MKNDYIQIVDLDRPKKELPALGVDVTPKALSQN